MTMFSEGETTPKGYIDQQFIKDNDYVTKRNRLIKKPINNDKKIAALL